MAEVKLNVTMTIGLTNAEYRLITLALAGKIVRGSNDDKAAKELNIRLLEMRARQHAEQQSAFAGALDKAIEELGDEEKRREAKAALRIASREGPAVAGNEAGAGGQRNLDGE